MSIFDKDFSDKLSMIDYSLLSDVEFRDINDYYKKYLNVEEEFISGTLFYKLVQVKLDTHFIFEDGDISDLSYIFKRIGIGPFQKKDLVYLIWKMPNQIVKLELLELIRKWDEIWCPPADDALIIFIPSKKTILFTHWGVVQCD